MIPVKAGIFFYMEFRTQIPIHDIEVKCQLDYDSKVLLLGSCFSENIGEKFDYFQLQSVINPFGILFHPAAILTFLKRALKEEQYSAADLEFHNELFHCFDAHSKLSHDNKEYLLKCLNEKLLSTKQFLMRATHVILTLGTAWVYKHIERGEYVANCHKIPQANFTKELLSVSEVYNELKEIQELLIEVNPQIITIYTVSPVRHIKDGFVENQRSKAHLNAGIHQLITENQEERLFYFPSYEIVMDELRDYRFYNTDMLHPNQVAIDYIWNRFKSVWVSDSIESIMKQVDVIQKGLKHKPFNPETKQHERFLNQLELKIQEIVGKFPHMKFEKTP